MFTNRTNILFVFLLFCLTGGYCQVLSNVNFANPREYYLQLLQATFNKVEEDNWCNLRIPDFSHEVNQEVYGFAVHGTVTYSNGFLISIEEIHIPQTSGVSQSWSHDADSGVTSGTMRTNVEMLEAAFGFDVRLDLNDSSTRHYTGVFIYERIRLNMMLVRAMQTDTMTASATVESVSGTGRRVSYLPADQTSQLLSREMGLAMAKAPWAVWEAVEAWGAQRVAPAMLDVASHQLQPPEVCYHCALTA